MDVLNRNIGRRQFISAGSMALGAGILARPSQLLAAEGGPPTGATAGGARGVSPAGGAPMGSMMQAGGSSASLKGEGKYGKYIIVSPKEIQPDTGMGSNIFPSTSFEGCEVTSMFIRFLNEGPSPCHATPLRSDYERCVFGFIGTDPEDPMELGAKEEYWLGEGENLEKYPTMQQSTVVYVPAGMRRWPLLNHSVKRPWTWIIFFIPVAPGAGTSMSSFSGASGPPSGGQGGAPGGAAGGPPSGAADPNKPRDMFIATPEEIANETWPNLTKEEKANARKSHHIYSQLLRSGVGPDRKKPKGGQWIAYLDAEIVAEAPLLRFIRYRPEEAPYPVINTQAHEYGTLLFFNGLDAADPGYLGAEIELCIGPEKEKHTINRSALIWIPANLEHGPFTVKKATKPFNFVECVAGPEHAGAVYKNEYP